MKNSLKKIKLLFVLLFAVFYSCEKDLYEGAFKQEEKSNFKIQTVTEKEILTNPTVSKILKKINLKQDNLTNRDIYDATNDIIIVTDYGIKIENIFTGNVSYNFPIIKNTNSTNSIENLVLTSNSQNGFNSFIVKYGFLELPNTNPSNPNTQIYPVNLDLSLFNSNELSKMVFECDKTWTYVSGEHNGNELHGALVNGVCPVASCSYNGLWVQTSTNCGYYDDGGGPGDDGGGPGGETVDDGIGGGNGGITTSPVVLTPKQLLVKKFRKQLTNITNGTPNQTTCFNSLSPENQIIIDNYIGSFALLGFDSSNPLSTLQIQQQAFEVA